MSAVIRGPSDPKATAIFPCGPSREDCVCKCDPEKGPDCGHVWNGHVVERELPGGASLSSVTCSRCGMLAADHDLWVAP